MIHWALRIYGLGLAGKKFIIYIGLKHDQGEVFSNATTPSGHMGCSLAWIWFYKAWIVA